MEHKLDCCVVRDLLPAYLEGLTEEETTRQVEAHLEECPACRRHREAMQASLPVVRAPKRALAFLKKVKRTRLIAAVLSAVVALLLIFLVYDSEYHWRGDLPSLTQGLQDYLGWTDHLEGCAIEALAATEVDGTLYVSFTSDSEDNVHGVAELDRGKTGRVYGDLMSLLTVMKGLPLAYNKDMQEDKEPVFDAVDTVEMCLPVFAAMLDTMTVRTDNMRKAAGHGFINATDCADYLTKKGMPFRDAYTVTGHLVAQCTARGKTLEELTLEELKAVSELFEADVYDALNLENCMALRSSYGGPAVAETARQIGEIEQFIQKIKENR